MAYDALSERKVRTLLTILMVVVGSSLMVVLNGLSAGQSNFVEEQLNQLADNVLTVYPGQRSFRSVDTTPSMVFNSVVVGRMNSLPYVSEVVPQYSGTIDIKSQANTIRTSVLSMDPEKVYLRVPNLPLEAGSVIKKNDPSAILIGNNVAYPDGATVPIVMLGQSVRATHTFVDDDGIQNENSRTFVVSGIMELTGDRTVDRSVIINEPTGNVFLKKSGKYDSLMIVAESSEFVEVVEQQIEELYGSSLGISNLQSRLQFRASFTSGTNAFISSVGLIALVVGAVGIITTLYTSVNERIKEIGTMKAIGTQNTTVLTLFLVEALLIGLIGATAGIIIGIISGYSLGSALTPPMLGQGSSVLPIFLLDDLARVWLLSVGLSMMAGIFPAWKASKLSPLVALRRE